MQDADSCFSTGVPGEAAGAGVPLGVRLSNYGRLAVVTTPAPDSHDDLAHAVRDGALSEADRSRIEAAPPCPTSATRWSPNGSSTGATTG
ncbi:hypothetical protein [Streptomyces erythrochromogenes]|uniref:hypothetical protein n=1 Tax=Streptomyces erythrochromogenes TaxID=285574 RepID=UPI003818E7FE